MAHQSTIVGKLYVSIMLSQCNYLCLSTVLNCICHNLNMWQVQISIKLRLLSTHVYCNYSIQVHGGCPYWSISSPKAFLKKKKISSRQSFSDFRENWSIFRQYGGFSRPFRPPATRARRCHLTASNDHTINDLQQKLESIKGGRIK